MKLAEALELLKDPEALRIRAAELDHNPVWKVSFDFGPRYNPPFTTAQYFETLDGAVDFKEQKDEDWLNRTISQQISDSQWGKTQCVTTISHILCRNEGVRYDEHFECLFAAERRLGLHDRSNTRLRVQWVNYMHDILAAQPDCSVNKVGNPLVSDIDKLLAPVEIRCAAFVMAAEWKAKQAEKEVGV